MPIVMNADNKIPVSDRFDGERRTSTLEILSVLLKRIPSIRRLRRESLLQFDSLRALNVTVSLPSSEQIYAWIERLCAVPHRRPGTAEGQSIEVWLAEELTQLGVEQVQSDPIPLPVWTPRHWSLKVDGQVVPCFYVPNSQFTAPDGVTAPLAYVGVGAERDFENVDVSGRIVVAEVPFPYMPTGLLMKGLGMSFGISDPTRDLTLRSGQYLNFVRKNFLGGCTAETAPKRDVYWQSVRRGARAICLVLRDQMGNANSHYGPFDGIAKPIPGLWIDKLTGRALIDAAHRGAQATLHLEGMVEPGETQNVWGILPGKSDKCILVTSHHDSPFEGATEDASGVAQVLAQAKAWAAVPREKRPKTLVFVLAGGHFHGGIGAHTFAHAHPETMKKTDLAITLEHLAAKEMIERDGKLLDSGHPALTVMFTTPRADIVATALKALAAEPAPLTVPIPADFFGPAPTSDARGYVLHGGVPIISWIGCPSYLLDENDTLDKINRSDLATIARTVAEIIKIRMAAD